MKQKISNVAYLFLESKSYNIEVMIALCWQRWNAGRVFFRIAFL